MTKTGRNDPCPCGSGQKYKRCCLEKDAAAESSRRAALHADNALQQARTPVLGLFRDEIDEEIEELTRASNAVVDMVHAGQLDEAEHAARDLLVRFPEVHDGYDRLGMVYEARGDYPQAVYYYRQVIEFVRARPDQYDPEFETTFHKLIAKLDPPAAG